ncbi:MAG: methylthioribulose 1-phosphate dehydratase [Leptolyngbyaceae cyanobacterium SL_1_1]|nr:methylthioribulose 1-phosphate dehydratase [Leptolyngbyaceae cyanobacterium RM1_1_2]NJO09507.1 methylthioribulose 1-phosphate dehydratase [Leptolyngbyaceae cyanobacterium SL_1_1]
MPNSTDLRESLCAVIHDIHAKGWAPGTGGNFSLVQQSQPPNLLMSPSGVDKGQVRSHDLIEIDAQGKVIAGTGKASAETGLHLAIVQATGAGAVLHTHSVFNTLLSRYFEAQGKIAIAGYEMLKGLRGVTTHDTTVELPVFSNHQDITDLAQQISPHLPSAPHGFLLAGHGLYAWGSTLFEAKRHLEVWEFLLEITYRALALSTSPLSNS